MTTQQGARRDFERPRGRHTLGWVIAALVVVGGIVAFLFFVIKPGAGGNHTSQQVHTLQTQLDGAQARANLATLRANLLTNASDQTVTQEYDAVRTQLHDTYANGGSNGVWKKLKPQLDNLKGQLTSDRQQAANTAQNILNSLPQG